MRSIAIINQKGGVGKTTTAVNLSAALADLGQRVGLIDLDPQAHATMHVGLEPGAHRPTTYDLLTSAAELADVWQPVAENLCVAGSDIDLAAAEVELAGTSGREVILRDKLRSIDRPLDYVLIDCPPSLGILTLNALAAVDDVFLPLQPHFLALHGLSKLLETVDLVAARLNRRLRLAGVVFCIYDSATRLGAEITRDVDQFFTDARTSAGPWNEVRVFAARIRRNVRLAEAPSFGKSIFAHDPRCHGADDYRRLAEEVLRLYAEPPMLVTSAAARDPTRDATGRDHVRQ